MNIANYRLILCFFDEDFRIEQRKERHGPFADPSQSDAIAHPWPFDLDHTAFGSRTVTLLREIDVMLISRA